MPSPPPCRAVHPIPAVIAVTFHEGQILLVQRANPPDAGLWGFPGGKIEFAETIEQAAVRELREETGIEATALDVVTALDAFGRNNKGEVDQHFTLIAVVCQWHAGAPQAADDALDAQWFPMTTLEDGTLPLSQDVIKVAKLALQLVDQTGGK